MSSGFVWGDRSLNELKGVHPALVAVMDRALELSDVDFGITSGLRSLEQQAQEVKEGDSGTMNSLHLKQDTGKAHAVDVAAYVDGKITWEWKYYRRIAKAVFRAAIELGVQVEWGGFWYSPVDGCHFQLSRRVY